MALSTLGFSTVGSGATAFNEYHVDYVSADGLRRQRIFHKTTQSSITSSAATAELAAVSVSYDKMYAIQKTAATGIALLTLSYGMITGMDVNQVAPVNVGDAPIFFKASVGVRAFGMQTEIIGATYAISDFYSGSTLLSASVNSMINDLVVLAEAQALAYKSTFDSGRW
jgi:hypothetical protein